MVGTVIFQEMISRRDVERNKQVLYVFGDNLLREGTGGQAKYGRRMVNAVGIVTKRKPSMAPDAFFSSTDTDLHEVVRNINEAFERIETWLKWNMIVVWPMDGVGTGRAQLKERCPILWEHLNYKIKELHRFLEVTRG